MTVGGNVTIDLLDPEAFAHGHPHDQYRWLRENAPVYRHPEPEGPGFWALTRYDDVRAVGRDPQTFSSEPTIMVQDPRPGDEMDLGDHKMMLTADPPLHTTLRRLVSGGFTPKASARWTERVQELATLIVDAVAARGECDLVEEVAGEMPSFVVAEMFGLPHEVGRELYQLTETIHAAPGTVPEGAQGAAVAQMFMQAAGVWARTQGEPGPPDDITTVLSQAKVGDRPFDEIDYALFFLLLVDAGGDTTRNLVAGGFDALFAHPDQLAWLLEDLDARLPTAVEELLRWVSPVAHMRRTATRDTMVGGQEIAAGDKVVMFYGAANRDPAHFADPERFDLSRHPNPHIAFGGGGPHFCLGAHLARIEIKALVRELLTRVPDLAPAGPTEWLPSVFISGPKHLPVRFTPA